MTDLGPFYTPIHDGLPVPPDYHRHNYVGHTGHVLVSGPQRHGQLRCQRRDRKRLVVGPSSSQPSEVCKPRPTYSMFNQTRGFRRTSALSASTCGRSQALCLSGSGVICCGRESRLASLRISLKLSDGAATPERMADCSPRVDAAEAK